MAGIDLSGADLWSGSDVGDSYDSWSMPSFNLSTDYSNWSQPINFDSMGSSWALPYTTDYGMDSGFNFMPDYFQGAQAPIYSTSDYGTTFQLPQGPMDFSTEGIGQLQGDKPWYSQLGSWALGNPDKAVGLGMGIFNGIGGMMAAKQSNKYAKKAAKRNDKLAAMEQQQWERMQRNQAINDKYNYSIDKTSPASVEYTPYQGNYATYGETGNPDMQLRVTPGETTRTQLYAQGGLANYALDGATGGQDDAIPALLSDGEYVFDADTVAALGDGNTQKGASALDQMRIEIRKHKRAAPVDKIPPKAKKATAYLKKGKK